MMPWWAWGLVGNVCVTYNEYVARTGRHASYLDALTGSWLIPSMLLLQAGIFYSYRGAPSMMFAWATFTLCGIVMRLASTHWALGEGLSWTTMAGIGLVLAGTYAIKVGG